MVEVKTRASEAKGPFLGGKRVGSWGKKKKTKAHGLRSMGLFFLLAHEDAAGVSCIAAIELK